MKRIAPLLASAILLAACTGSSRAIRHTDDLARDASPRIAIAHALQVAGDARDDEAAAAWIAAAWRHRGHTSDDRLLREDLAAVDVEACGEILRPARLLEETRVVLDRGDPEGAIRLARRARDGARGVDDGWTFARATLLASSLSRSAWPERAQLWLEDGAKRGLAGGPGAYLQGLMHLTLAGIHHGEGRLREAIAAYLELGPDSGLWRRARLGLAWAQLRAGRPERTLKILALLPGGLTGDPERAVPAAMAAHGLGRVDAAVGIAEEAVARLGAWDRPEDLPEAILEAARASPRGPRLRQAEEGLVERLSDAGRLRLLARELLASRELVDARPEDAAVAAYARRLEASWVEMVDDAASDERERIDEAVRELEALRPQLR